MDIVSPEKRSQMMAGIKGKNTRPEMLVRRLVHGMGFRYRLHRRDL
ncbi:MAG: very short patch repair endonuclease, partial [Betaproteobacteria bacterium]